jgi:hypothetical protein
MTKENEPNNLIPLLAEIVYMGELAKACGDKRSERIRKVRDRRYKALTELGSLDPQPVQQALKQACASLDDNDRGAVLSSLIDTSNPFRPHVIAFDGDERLHAITGVATVMGVQSDLAQRIHAAWEIVDGQHRGVSTAEIVGLGALIAAAAATGGLAFYAAAAGGAVAGGAAITTGLASVGNLVGGGMVAGTVVFAVGGGAIAASGVQFAAATLAEIPTSVLTAEVRRTQIIIAALHANDDEVIDSARAGMKAIRKELKHRLKDEESVSDKGSWPIKELKSAVEVTETAYEWLNNPKGWGLEAEIGKRKREFKETLRAVKRVVD